MFKELAMTVFRWAAAIVLLAAAATLIFLQTLMAQVSAGSLGPSTPQPNSFGRTATVADMDASGKIQYRTQNVLDPAFPIVQPADPELAALQAVEVEAAKEAQNWLQKLQTEESEGKRAELKTELRTALAKQFEAQQKQRTREIGSIEERLNKLKETLKKRDAAKDTIVDRRLDQLMGVTDELAWEETQGVPSGLPRAQNYSAPKYAPGTAPQTPLPKGPKVPPPPTKMSPPLTVQPNASNQFPSLPALPLPPVTSLIPSTLPGATPRPVVPSAPPAPPALPVPAAPAAAPAPPAALEPAAPAAPPAPPAPPRPEEQDE
jgi:hypothetical protein